MKLFHPKFCGILVLNRRRFVLAFKTLRPFRFENKVVNGAYCAADERINGFYLISVLLPVGGMLFEFVFQGSSLLILYEREWLCVFFLF